MTRIPAYRLSPDAMMKSAADLGCQLLVPQTSANYRWTWDCTPIVIVVNNSSDADWWQDLARQSAGVCLIFGRLRWEPKWRDGNLQGQHAFYFGDDIAGFCAEFRQYGGCWERA
jgi:hypothetical protein